MEESSRDTRPPQAGEAQGEPLRPDDEMNRLRTELEEAKAQAEKNLDLAKRIQADFDNYKKRAQREKEEQIKAGNDKLLYDLLGFLDDFERALAAKATPEEFRQGVESIHANLRSLLQSKGLVETPCERFDPALHEALLERLTQAFSDQRFQSVGELALEEGGQCVVQCDLVFDQAWRATMDSHYFVK